MYIESVPNPNSPPAILLRESYREHGRVRKRTLCNLSDWPTAHIEGLRGVLKGGTVIAAEREAFIVTRTLLHGHVAAALGTARKIGLDRCPRPGWRSMPRPRSCASGQPDPRSRVQAGDRACAVSRHGSGLSESTARWTGCWSASPLSRPLWRSRGDGRRPRHDHAGLDWITALRAPARVVAERRIAALVVRSARHGFHHDA